MVTAATALTDVLGGKTAGALRKSLGLDTVGDLLRHYPRRYAERGELTDLAHLRPGDEVTVLAEVRKVSRRPMRQRRGSILEVVVTDGRGTLTLTFFNQPWREKDPRWAGGGCSPGRSPSSTASGSSTAPTSGSSTPRSRPATSRSSPAR